MLDSPLEVTNGPHGCAVAAARAPLTDAAPTVRWSRASLARPARCPERDSLGDADRGAVEGSAAAVPTLPDRPPALSALGPERDDGPGPPPLGARARRRRGIRLHRGLHRCDLRGREKRGAAVGLTRKGNGTKSMAIADGAGLPLAVTVASANPAETALVDATLQARFLRRKITRLIGDKGYDSDTLDARLAKRGIECIAPNRSTRRHNKQDGRPLRRYCRRWKVERLFAWLQNFRRLVTRYERHVENFLAFVQLACIVIFSRRFVR